MATYYLDPEEGDDIGSDFSMCGRVRTLFNGATSTNAAAKFGSYSLSFPTATATVGFPQSSSLYPLTYQFTIDTWVYLTSWSAGTAQAFASCWQTTASGLAWYLGTNTSGQICFRYSLNGSTIIDTVVAAWTPTLNQWYFISVDRDASGVIRLYVDGVVMVSVADTGSIGGGGSLSIRIGNTGNSSRTLGYIQDFRFTRGVARYAGAFTPPTAALPIGYKNDPYWGMVQLLVPGRMSGAGTDFASSLRTPEVASTKMSSSGGDIVRIRASKAPTAVGNATWTAYSKTVTLASAVTAMVADCDSNWTASASVTSALDTSSRKTGTASVKLTIASGFTTGKVAYFATGTLNLSAYQQISLWFWSSVGTTSGAYTLNLCSDTTGDVPVHSIILPPYENFNSGTWVPVVADLGVNLNSSIKSVSITANYDLSTSTSVTLSLDHIIACKASSSPDSLTLHSLIAKENVLSWEPSTTYTAGQVRRPTVPNRNGFEYYVITGGTSGASEPSWIIGDTGGVSTIVDGTVVWGVNGLEENWYPIQSITDTTVLIDSWNNQATSGRGYNGSSGSTTMYKREPTVSSYNSNSSISNQWSTGGTLTNPNTISGGWNYSDMSAQTEETWWTGVNGSGILMYYSATSTYLNFEHMNGTRFYSGFGVTGSGFPPRTSLKHVHVCGMVNAGLNLSRILINDYLNVAAINCATDGINSGSEVTGTAVKGSGNSGSNLGGIQGGSYRTRLNWVEAKNNLSFGFGTFSGNLYDFVAYNVQTGSNGIAAFHPGTSINAQISDAYIVNGTCPETTIVRGSDVGSTGAASDAKVYLQNLNGVPAQIVHFGATVMAVTDVIHNSEGGYAWRFNVTNTTRGRYWPVRLSVLKMAVEAGSTYNVRIWARRDNANIKGQLMMQGGQIVGVPIDLTVSTDPTALNTWEVSAPLTFTANSEGVVEVEFLCYCESGTTNQYWIDDVTVS